MPIKILDKNSDLTGQYCYFCNATITDSMIFCENCGSKNKSRNMAKTSSFSRSLSASESSSDNPQLIKMIQCPNCKAKIKENFEFCPMCKFHLKEHNKNIFDPQNHLSEVITDKKALQDEIHFTTYLIRMYVVGLGLGFCIYVIAIINHGLGQEMFDYNNIKLLIFMTTCVSGPMVFFLGLTTLSYKENSFYYNNLTNSNIIDQIQSQKFILVNKKGNQFTFQRKDFTVMRIVVVFDKDLFLIYCPKGVMKNFRKKFGWRSYDQKNTVIV